MRTDLEYAMFTKGEMERRYSRARELVARSGVDALFVTGEENFQYLAGASASLALHGSLTHPSMFILPQGREPVIVTQGRKNLTLGCYVRDVRDYVGVLEYPHDAVLSALSDALPHGGRLGVELGREQRLGMPAAAFQRLQAALDTVEFVDAAEILIKLRMVKSAEEATYVRSAADITGRARQRLFDAVVPGMTERDVVRLMRRLILEEGGDRTSFVILQLDYPGSGNQFPYDRPLRRGDVLAVDAGAYAGMYTVDYARMATLGKATDEQRRVHEAVLEVNRKMTEALGPGVSCSDIHATVVEAIAEAGVTADPPERLSHGRMGHGQGMLLTEPPSISPMDHTVLEPGMVISTEPGVSSGDVHFLWEDVHLITEDGSEQLTLETDDLREIQF